MFFIVLFLSDIYMSKLKSTLFVFLAQNTQNVCLNDSMYVASHFLYVTSQFFRFKTGLIKLFLKSYKSFTEDAKFLYKILYKSFAKSFTKGLTVNFKKNFGIPILLEWNKKVKLSLQVYVTSHLFSWNKVQLRHSWGLILCNSKIKVELEFSFIENAEIR